MERTEQLPRIVSNPARVDGTYLDWPAIFGGGVVALGIGSVFASFGAALGLSTISARPGAGSFDVMVLVSAVWSVLALVSSYMAGGYIAGRMRRRIDDATADEVSVRDGINGLIVWGLGMIISVALLQAAVFSTLAAGGAAVQTGVKAAAVATQGTSTATVDPLDFALRAMLRPARIPSGSVPASTTSGDAAAILANVVKTGDITAEEKDYLSSLVTASSGLAPDVASARVDTAVQTARGLRDEAVQATEAARMGVILTAFLIGAASLVAAVAAQAGAVAGGKHRDEGRLFSGFAHGKPRRPA